MRRIWRLLLYVRPYMLYLVASVALMAMVGAMAALRIVLVRPIFDNILSPDAPTKNLLRFPIPQLGRTIEKLVARQASGQPHGFTQRIDRIDLAAASALFDTPHDQSETVGAEIDRGQEFRVFNHASQ